MGLLYSSRRALLDEAVAAPWWDPDGEGLCVWAAYQSVGATSFAASLVDRSPSTNTAVDPGGAATPGWNAVNGWIFDGIANYLTTTFVPQNDQSQSVLVQFTGIANQNVICGQSDAAGRRFQILPNRLGAHIRYTNGGSADQPPSLLAGNLGIAGNQGYRNGGADGAPIGAWVGAAVASFLIGTNSVMATFCACNIQALAIYDCTLTAPQMLAIATAMAAL